MPAATHIRLNLRPHPATLCPQVLAVQASLKWQCWQDPPLLRLWYRTRGHTAALRVPAPEPPGPPAEDLWRHLCFEAFFGVSDGDGRYHEFNFSPSGRWGAFAFSAPRVREAHHPTVASRPLWKSVHARNEANSYTALVANDPLLKVVHAEHAILLTAALPVSALPPLGRAPGWQVGLSAVIETADGALSYWALAHPAPRPDFHQRAGWTLRLTPP